MATTQKTPKIEVEQVVHPLWIISIPSPEMTRAKIIRKAGFWRRAARALPAKNR
jgi:hypothetical protein